MDNPFAEDWRQSTIAHWMDIVRRGDRVAESTHRAIMAQLGFSEQEIEMLKLEATMKIENLESDFIPEVNIESIGID